MHHTDDDGGGHLEGVGRSREFAAHHLIVVVQGRTRRHIVYQRQAEERAQGQAHQCRRHTEGEHHVAASVKHLTHNRRLTRLSGNLQEAVEGNDDAIAGVAHTDGKEEGEEGCHDGRGIPLVVARETVHLGQTLKHAVETVVAQADGHIVRSHRIAHLVVGLLFGQESRDGRLLTHGKPSLHHHHKIAGGALCLECGLFASDGAVDFRLQGDDVAEVVLGHLLQLKLQVFLLGPEFHYLALHVLQRSFGQLERLGGEGLFLLPFNVEGEEIDELAVAAHLQPGVVGKFLSKALH